MGPLPGKSSSCGRASHYAVRVHPVLRVAAALPAAVVLVAVLAGAWVVLFGGLLIEPVDMRALGPCEDEPDCVRVRCRFQNQGPLPARGPVLVDVWTHEDAQQGHRRTVPARVRVPLNLDAGEIIDLAYDVPGVRYVPGRTMVRCMPWFAGGRSLPGDESVAARPVAP